LIYESLNISEDIALNCSVFGEPYVATSLEGYCPTICMQECCEIVGESIVRIGCVSAETGTQNLTNTSLEINRYASLLDLSLLFNCVGDRKAE
jgi:hypothetical protein